MGRWMRRSPSCRQKGDELAAKLWDVTWDKHKRGKGMKKAPECAEGLREIVLVQMLVRREMKRLVRPAGAGNSTVSEISLLLRRTPSFTVRSLSSCFAESFPRSSPTVRMRSPLSEVITSPAFTPAFSAGEPELTSRTSS